MTNNVYIVNNPGNLDFSKAARYGNLVDTTRKVNVYRPEAVLAELEESLSGFRETDFLLLAGNALSIFLSGLCLPDHVLRLQLLVWDQKEKDYIVRTIDIT